MGLSAEDMELLEQLKAERSNGKTPTDKVNGKRRVAAVDEDETEGRPRTRSVEVQQEESEDPPADKRPTKAPAKRRARRTEVEEVEEKEIVVETTAESVPPSPTLELRDMLATGALTIALEFASKDADLTEIATVAYELADAMLVARAK